MVEGYIQNDNPHNLLVDVIQFDLKRCCFSSLLDHQLSFFATLPQVLQTSAGFIGFSGKGAIIYHFLGFGQS